MALSEGALKQVSECDGASQLEQRLWVVKVFHLMGVLVEQCSGVDRLGNVAHQMRKSRLFGSAMQPVLYSSVSIRSEQRRNLTRIADKTFA